jgi:gamma-glutamyltranspeptidase/glutathione hydrolase
MHKNFRWPALAALLLAACASPPVAERIPAASAAAVTVPPPQPEAASGFTPKPGWATTHFAVAAANPLATEAGYRVLKAGGSAVDAAVAVQMVLALVEPQSSGLGGGTLLVHWDGLQAIVFDGRETAPAAADERLFLRPDGTPMGFHEAVVGGRSVGTPGTLRALEMAHRQYGKLPWATLFEPAIALARDGFRISPRLHALLAGEQSLKDDAAARAYFYKPDGTPKDEGALLRNPELARVLQAIAHDGADAFYRGRVAQDIVAKVHAHPTNPGLLAESDLARYAAKRRDALCGDWRQYRLCGPPPPSSGEIAILQILGLMDAAPLPSAPPLVVGLPGADLLHVYSEASRLAFADRNAYVADPDFVEAPAGRWQSLVEPGYLRQRAALIGPRAMTSASPGRPEGARLAFGAMPEQVEHGTSHLSIVDVDGHALAMTTTIEDGFGSRQMVDGFLLNNELTDFSFAPADAAGRPIANRVQPGKRPRSSMSPTLAFDRASGRLVMTTGSPGGALIIHFTAKALLGTLAWGLDAQQAISLPNFGALDGTTLLESGRFPPATIQALRARGHAVSEVALPSGLQAIQRTPTGFFGGADPRREGIVAGD